MLNHTTSIFHGAPWRLVLGEMFARALVRTLRRHKPIGRSVPIPSRRRDASGLLCPRRIKTFAFLLLLFYSLLFMFPEKSVAQVEPFGFRFQTYSTQHGLASNQVRSIAEDADGFIWAATEDGVSRFDGFQFKNYELSIKDSIADSNRNTTAKILRVGRQIWVMNQLFELFIFDRSQDRFVFSSMKGVDDCLTTNRGNHPDFLFDESRNCIWMVDCFNLLKFNLAGGPPKIWPFYHNGRCNGSMQLDHKGRLWLGSYRGTICFDPETEQIRHFAGWRHIIGQDFTFPFLLFAGGLDTLFRLDLRTDSMTAVPVLSPEHQAGKGWPTVDKITFPSQLTGDSILWTGFFGEGIRLINLKTGQILAHFNRENSKKQGLTHSRILNFFIASDSILWVGGEAGLMKIDQRQQAFFSKELAPFKKRSMGRVLAVYSNPDMTDRKWVLTNTEGLTDVDDRTNEARQPEFAPADNQDIMRNMTLDPTHGLSIASDVGLFQLLPGGRLRKSIPGFTKNKFVRQFSIVSQDTVWVTNGYETGLWLPVSGEYFPVNLPPSNLHFLNRGTGGSLLVSNSTGLYRVRPESFDPINRCFPTAEKIELPAGQTDGWYSLEEPRFLWTRLTNGLGRLDKTTGEWQVFGEKEGLSNTSIWSILKDRQGHLWLNSENGLFVFFPDDKRFKRFTEDDGLVQNLVTGIMSDDGEWFHIGFENSYSSWKPNARLQKVAKSPVFTGFWALNRPVCLHPDSLGSATFEVRHTENILRFEFTCTDFYQSEKITFEYQLDGFDQHVVAAGTARSATYTNLDGGSYSLKVWAINADGYRCAEPAILRFRVVPPFYRTWWFLVLSLAVIGGIFYAIFQNRLRQRLEKEAIRLRIARDLHDEVGSTLTTISILSESALRNVELDLEKSRMTNIGEKARTALSSMSDIVWAVNPQNDPMEKVVERMTRFASETLENAGISPVFNIEKEVFHLVLPMEKRKDFYLFFKEATTNVAKHSRANKAVFSLKKENSHLVFELSDDGIGLPEKQTGSLGGNGLANMQARAAALGAKFWIKNEEKQGVLVHLALPIA